MKSELCPMTLIAVDRAVTELATSQGKSKDYQEGYIQAVHDVLELIDKLWIKGGDEK